MCAYNTLHAFILFVSGYIAYIKCMKQLVCVYTNNRRPRVIVCVRIHISYVFICVEYILYI